MSNDYSCGKTSIHTAANTTRKKGKVLLTFREHRATELQHQAKYANKQGR
uniref:Uncharacterized protein n=1 Tax=Setaria italica TaxID=4555 RepID=K3ZKZ7_SETIT